VLARAIDPGAQEQFVYTLVSIKNIQQIKSPFDFL
jgi:hypothetical protein